MGKLSFFLLLFIIIIIITEFYCIFLICTIEAVGRGLSKEIAKRSHYAGIFGNGVLNGILDDLEHVILVIDYWPTFGKRSKENIILEMPHYLKCDQERLSALKSQINSGDLKKGPGSN